MRRAVVLAVVAVLALSGLAWAATYTIGTTAAQDARIGRARIVANQRNIAGAPYTSDQDFVERQCRDNHLRSLVASLADAQDDEIFEAAWDAASASTRNSICSALGLSAGCKP